MTKIPIRDILFLEDDEMITLEGFNYYKDIHNSGETISVDVWRDRGMGKYLSAGQRHRLCFLYFGANIDNVEANIYEETLEESNRDGKCEHLVSNLNSGVIKTIDDFVLEVRFDVPLKRKK